MKPHKNGLKKTTSFISNQQLIQNMRNRSANNLIRIDSKQKNKQKQKSKDKQVNISLIEPKKYHHQSIKNMLNVSNIDAYDSNNSFRMGNYQTTMNSMGLINNYCQNQNVSPNVSLKLNNKSNHKQVTKATTSYIKTNASTSEVDNKKQHKSDNLIKFLKQNISDQKLVSRVQNLLQEQQTQKKEQYHISKQQTALLAKIQELYIQKTRIKRQKKQQEQRHKQQIKQYIQRQQELKKENQRLHKLILKQSEMITNQANNELDATADLRRILLTQAKAIEGLEGICKKSRTSANSSVMKSR